MKCRWCHGETLFSVTGLCDDCKPLFRVKPLSLEEWLEACPDDKGALFVLECACRHLRSATLARGVASWLVELRIMLKAELDRRQKGSTNDTDK
jgi:hypothetical protein